MELRDQKSALNKDVKLKIVDTLVAAGIICTKQSGKVTISLVDGGISYIEVQRTIK